MSFSPQWVFIQIFTNLRSENFAIRKKKMTLMTINFLILYQLSVLPLSFLDFSLGMFINYVTRHEDEDEKKISNVKTT